MLKGTMMERLPEPDLMDSVEQARAYAETDFSEPHDEFVKQFSKCFPHFSKGNVLDLGCGTADVIIRFAKAFPDVKITGIDGAKSMLDIGMQEVFKSSVSPRIRLQKCFLPDDTLTDNEYDIVISNSLLHHMKDPLIMWQTIKRCAKYKSPIFVMDLFRPETQGKADEIVSMHAADAPPLLQKDFYNSLLAAYTKEEIIDQLNTAKLNCLDVEIISDRHVIAWGENNDE